MTSTWWAKSLPSLVSFPGVLGQQDCGSDFHRQCLAVAGRLFREPVGGIGNRLAEPAVVGMAELFDGLMQCAPAWSRKDCRAGAEPAQNLFQASSVALIVSRRRRRCCSCGLPSARQAGVRQLIGVLDLSYEIAVAVCLSDVIQCVAHQALGDVLRAFEQTADLQVDARTQLLDVDFAGSVPSESAVSMPVATTRRHGRKPVPARASTWRVAATSISATPAAGRPGCAATPASPAGNGHAACAAAAAVHRARTVPQPGGGRRRDRGRKDRLRKCASARAGLECVRRRASGATAGSAHR